MASRFKKDDTKYWMASTDVLSEGHPDICNEAKSAAAVAQGVFKVCASLFPYVALYFVSGVVFVLVMNFFVVSEARDTLLLVMLYGLPGAVTLPVIPRYPDIYFPHVLVARP